MTIITSNNAPAPSGGGGSDPGPSFRNWPFSDPSGATVIEIDTGQNANLTSTFWTRNQPSIVTSGSGASTVFNGFSYGDVPGSPPFGNVDFDNFSISAWVNFSSLGSENPIYGQYAPFVGSGINCNLEVDGSGNLFFSKDPATGSPLVSTVPVSTSTTYHIVYAEGTTTRAFYVDGGDGGSDNAPQTFTGTDAFQALIVANETFPAANVTIQDLRLYNSELTAANALYIFLNS